MTNLYHPDVTQWLQLSGQYIVQNLPREERVPWILFLMDEMKQFMAEEDYTAMLDELQDELQTRLRQDKE